MISKKALYLHKKYNGKISITSKIQNLKKNDIRLIYTPGVAAVSKEIHKLPLQVYSLTSKAIAKTMSEKDLDYDHILPDLRNKNLQKIMTVALSKFKVKRGSDLHRHNHHKY